MHVLDLNKQRKQSSMRENRPRAQPIEPTRPSLVKLFADFCYANFLKFARSTICLFGESMYELMQVTFVLSLGRVYTH